MEHMALVLDSHQLLDDPDQTISLMGDKMQSLYAGKPSTWLSFKRGDACRRLCCC
jgi:hypothetical protein